MSDHWNCQTIELSDYFDCRTIEIVRLLKLLDYWNCQTIEIFRQLKLPDYWNCQTIEIERFYATRKKEELVKSINSLPMNWKRRRYRTSCVYYKRYKKKSKKEPNDAKIGALVTEHRWREEEREGVKEEVSYRDAPRFRDLSAKNFVPYLMICGCFNA